MTSSKAPRGRKAQAAAQPATDPQPGLDSPEHQAMAEIAASTDRELEELRTGSPSRQRSHGAQHPVATALVGMD